MSIESPEIKTKHSNTNETKVRETNQDKVDQNKKVVGYFLCYVICN